MDAMSVKKVISPLGINKVYILLLLLLLNNIADTNRCGLMNKSSIYNADIECRITLQNLFASED